jgi:hypothetical protein
VGRGFAGGGGDVNPCDREPDSRYEGIEVAGEQISFVSKQAESNMPKEMAGV